MARFMMPLSSLTSDDVPAAPPAILLCAHGGPDPATAVALAALMAAARARWPGAAVALGDLRNAGATLLAALEALRRTRRRPESVRF